MMSIDNQLLYSCAAAGGLDFDCDDCVSEPSKKQSFSGINSSYFITSELAGPMKIYWRSNPPAN